LDVILPEPEQTFESELISICIEICYKEVDIEASNSKPASSTPIVRYDAISLLT